MIEVRPRSVFLIRPPVVAVDVFSETEVALVDSSERLVLSVAEAAELLGISKSLAYDLVARGELPARRFGGRIVVLWRPLERLPRGRATRRGLRPGDGAGRALGGSRAPGEGVVTREVSGAQAEAEPAAAARRRFVPSVDRDRPITSGSRSPLLERVVCDGLASL